VSKEMMTNMIYISHEASTVSETESFKVGNLTIESKSSGERYHSPTYVEAQDRICNMWVDLQDDHTVPTKGRIIAKNKQSQLTKSQCQASIDAEPALRAQIGTHHEDHPKLWRSVREVMQPESLEKAGTSNPNWNVPGLASIEARKSKFWRLLWGGSSATAASGTYMEKSKKPVFDGQSVDAELKRQYQEGQAYEHDARRKISGF